MIEEDWTRAVWHGDLGYLLFAGPNLRLFGSDGSFVKVIGREGEGPGEFRWINEVQVVQTRIAALDFHGHAWSIFDADGSFVRRKSYRGDLGRGRFAVAGGDTVVLATEVERDQLGWLVLMDEDVRDDRWRDARLDVIDLASGRHLGHYRLGRRVPVANGGLRRSGI
ncbi:MAG: 6-bladed beta-propeller [Gemmatimonadetes bacterium]|nr:6-bladed beta-propeller [Gemmatimonadota bacterium]